MRRAGWSAQGSLPSDRIKTTKPRPTPKTVDRAERAPPKSKEILHFDALLEGLRHRSENRADPTGGCFCQARMHPLSSYTPICRNCGLIICELNQPFYTCPFDSCASALLSPTGWSSLVAKIEAQVSETLKKEEQAKQQAIDDARKAEGDFPHLPGLAAGGTVPSRPVQESRKVLSIRSGSKADLTSYTRSSSSSRTSSLNARRGNETDIEGVKRVPAPSKEVEPIELGLKAALYVPTKPQGGGEDDPKRKKE